jgi:hypothetical protein
MPTSHHARRPSQLKRTAYHEAGHAVVSFALRRAVRRVSIVPGEEFLGRCTLAQAGDPDGLPERQERARAEREILVLLAGGLAEAKLAGRHNHAGASQDIDAAFSWATRVSGSMEEAEAYLAWLRVRARHLLDVPEHWSAVEALAAELLQRREVSGRAARRVYLAAQR